MRLAPLNALQQIDGRLYALRRQRDALPGTLSASEARVAEARLALEEFRKVLRKAKVDVDRRELDLKTLEAKILQLDGQLNQVKTNKEYALLKKEVDGFRGDKVVLDDEILQLYATYEEKEKEGKVLAERLRALETELEAARSQVEAASGAIEKEILAVEKEREVYVADVDPDILKGYLRILKGKGDGLALVPVVDGVCQGCYMDLTSQEVNLLLMDREIRAWKDIVICRNCCRILYIAKKPAATPAEGRK